jgi:hypothetical protein
MGPHGRLRRSNPSCSRSSLTLAVGKQQSEQLARPFVLQQTAPLSEDNEIVRHNYGIQN